MKYLTLILLLSISAVNYAQKLTVINTIGKFDNATSLSINTKDEIFISDAGVNEIIKIDTTGKVLQNEGGYGWGSGAFDEPADIYSTALNIYVADKNNDRIQIFDNKLNYLSEFKTSTVEDEQYTFLLPTGVALSNQGDLFILDSENQRVLKYNMRGEFILEIGSFDFGEFALSEPTSIESVGNGYLFVANDNRLFVYDEFGNGINIINMDITINKVSGWFKYLTLTSKEIVITYNLAENKMTKYQLPKDVVINDALFYRKKLYLLTPQNVIICDVK